jgi:hypothetical protein
MIAAAKRKPADLRPQRRPDDFGRERGEFAGLEAFLQCRQKPLARRKHPTGSTAQRAANEDDPDFYPLWVIYGALPRGALLGPHCLPSNPHSGSAIPGPPD